MHVKCLIPYKAEKRAQYMLVSAIIKITVMNIISRESCRVSLLGRSLEMLSPRNGHREGGGGRAQAQGRLVRGS